MYILYFDASGTPELQDFNSKHYVVLGFSLRESSWHSLHSNLNLLKLKYELPGIPFELHVREFAVSISEQNDIPNFESLSWPERRRKVIEIRDQRLSEEKTGESRSKRKAKYRTTDAFVHLTRKERSQLLDDAIEKISLLQGVKLFCEAIDKSHPKVVAKKIDPVVQGFTQVISRFDKFLQQIDRSRYERNPRSSPHQGLLILDNDESNNDKYGSLFDVFRKDGHDYGQITHVIDIPFFADSHRVPALQFADVCAYVVRRYHDKGAEVGSFEEKQFRRLFPLFDRDTFGNLHGLRHYVSTGNCSCLICRERSHSTNSPSE